jgi:outer membrane protein assembly factor BamB
MPVNTHVSLLVLVCSATMMLSGCSLFTGSDDEKIPLPGERVSVLELQKALEPTDTALKAEGFISPAPWNNEFWTGAGGYPNHNLQHLALSEQPLKKIWSADIGEGGTKNYPLTARPIVFNNVVYTMDSSGVVKAFDTNKGKQIWSNSTKPDTEDEKAISGGMAVTTSSLLVTNGYGEILAINPDKGGIVWRSKLSAPARSAPTIVDNIAYILSLDNTLSAYQIDNGQRLWSYEGFSETASLLGSSSPAAEQDLVIAAMSSGEITALRMGNGAVVWSDSLSPSFQSGGGGTLPDISALPVIDKGSVFALSYANKLVNLDLITGQRIWSRDIGGAKDLWISGNMIFFISSDSQLIALGRDTGALAWVKELSSYDDNSETKFKNSLEWNGPILAGNRLIITDDKENLLEISPQDGALIRRLDLGFHVALPPVVAGETLYLVSDNGTLTAWK